MLLTNQQLDKLAATRIEFESLGMLHGALPMRGRTTDEPKRDDAVVEGMTTLGDVSLARQAGKFLHVLSS